MVIALLLAQLVLPGPPSGPIQPPGMICMGECDGGPAVYRTSQRGKLVVACDMRSDTCSDGRQITTTRATPVPCETSPGVWQTIPEDTGCYSVRGLESWDSTTSYLSWGAELDRSPWVGAAVPASQGYQITGPLSQSMAAVEVAEQRTTAWILRADTPRLVTIGVQPTGGCEVEVGTEWRTYSCTEQVAIGVSPEARITQPVGQSVYGIAAWHTRSATPGRPCWGGEAPVTCDDDRHTVSTEGWPTTEGEISVAFTVPAAGVSDDSRMILDGRVGGGSGYLRVSSSNNLQLIGGTPTIITIANTPPREEPYNLRLSVSSGVMRVWLDGAELAPRESVFPAWGPEATLGSGYLNAQHLNGTISRLSWSTP